MDSLRAAVANGANAVYFGLSNFNARHRATNFTLEELISRPSRGAAWRPNNEPIAIKPVS